MVNFKVIASAHPKFLAATDVLIGDMSDINYEFLIFNRPIILLANQWLRENFPDIGIKTDIAGLEMAVERSIEHPLEFAEERKHWHKKTMHNPDGNSSKRVIDTIVNNSNIINPAFIFVHGGSDVIKHFLNPLFNEAQNREINSFFVRKIIKNNHNNNNIYVSANNDYLSVPYGYKVHVDHGLKGEGVTDFNNQIIQYKEKGYHKFTNLHITEGELSYLKTKILLGPFANRTQLVGFPKSDDLIKLNSIQNKNNVCKELNFNPHKRIITYAPAGRYSYPFKQGASFNSEVVNRLKEISKKNDYNILIKLKYPKYRRTLQQLKKLVLKSFLN